jgi:hypothetical protein
MMHTQPYYNYPEVWQNGGPPTGAEGVAKPNPLFVAVPNDVHGSVENVAAKGSSSASLLLSDSDKGEGERERERERERDRERDRDTLGPPSNGYSFGANMPAGVSWRYVDVLSNIHHDDR